MLNPFVELPNKNYFGTITDATYKLEVNLIATENPKIERGTKLKVTGHVRKGTYNVISTTKRHTYVFHQIMTFSESGNFTLWVNNLVDIEILPDPLMPLDDLFQGIQKLPN